MPRRPRSSASRHGGADVQSACARGGARRLLARRPLPRHAIRRGARGPVDRRASAAQPTSSTSWRRRRRRRRRRACPPPPAEAGRRPPAWRSRRSQCAPRCVRCARRRRGRRRTQRAACARRRRRRGVAARVARRAPAPARGGRVRRRGARHGGGGAKRRGSEHRGTVVLSSCAVVWSSLCLHASRLLALTTPALADAFASELRAVARAVRPPTAPRRRAPSRRARSRPPPPPRSHAASARAAARPTHDDAAAAASIAPLDGAVLFVCVARRTRCSMRSRSSTATARSACGRRHSTRPRCGGDR